MNTIIGAIFLAISCVLNKTREGCDCPIDCQVNNTVEVQRSMIRIARVVHLPSVVQSEFYEATRILLQIACVEADAEACTLLAFDG